MQTEMCFLCSGSRFDRGLGGFEMDLRLRDYLAKLFNEQKKSKNDVRQNHRAMAKLLKEAQRLKTVLSANVDFMAQVSPVTSPLNCQSRNFAGIIHITHHYQGICPIWQSHLQHLNLKTLRYIYLHIRLTLAFNVLGFITELSVSV